MSILIGSIVEPNLFKSTSVPCAEVSLRNKIFFAVLHEQETKEKSRKKRRHPRPGHQIEARRTFLCR